MVNILCPFGDYLRITPACRAALPICTLYVVFFKKKRLKAQYIIGWEERCLGGEGKWSGMGLARPDCGCLRTIGFVRKHLSDFVPAEGLNDRSDSTELAEVQAIYCLVSVRRRGTVRTDALGTRYLIRGRGVLVPGSNDRIRRTYSLDLNDRRWDSVIGDLG